jgi:hypothetical protein
MTEQIKKPIANVIINYEDGTHDELYHYAVVGLSEDTWFSVMFSPLKTNAKIKMNNMLVELSNVLLKSINQER